MERKIKTQRNVIVEMERKDTEIKKIVFGKEDTFKIIWEDDKITEYDYSFKRQVNNKKYIEDYIEGVQVNEERICKLCNKKIEPNESHIEKVLMDVENNTIVKVLEWYHFECP